MLVIFIERNQYGNDRTIPVNLPDDRTPDVLLTYWREWQLTANAEPGQECVEFDEWLENKKEIPMLDYRTVQVYPWAEDEAGA